MELLNAGVNAVVVAIGGLLLAWYGKGRFEALERRIDRLEERWDARFDRLEARFDRLETRFDAHVDRTG